MSEPTRDRIESELRRQVRVLRASVVNDCTALARQLHGMEPTQAAINATGVVWARRVLLMAAEGVLGDELDGVHE